MGNIQIWEKNIESIKDDKDGNTAVCSHHSSGQGNPGPQQWLLSVTKML